MGDSLLFHRQLSLLPEETPRAVVVSGHVMECIHCTEIKAVEEFRPGRTVCRSCEQSKTRDRYSVGYDIVRKAKDGPCMDCGQRYPSYVMDLDHRPTEKKLFNVSGASLKTTPEAILEEIAKCDLVCANCHRIRTYERLKALEPTLNDSDYAGYFQDDIAA